MREVSGGKRDQESRSRRSPPRRRAEHEARELRVIEGGRRGSRAGNTARTTEAQPRRREVSGTVKRRRRIATVVLFMLAAGLITYVLLGPVTRMMDSRRNLSHAEAQLAEERSRTQVLEERKSRDQTDEYVEWEARKMGYVKPGEIPIIVLDDKEEDTAENSPDMTAP